MKTKWVVFLFFLFSFLMVGNTGYSQSEQITKKESTAKSSKKIELKISGMSCQKGCADGIDKKLRLTEGIIKSKTSFEKSKSVITFNPLKISVEEIIKKISDFGYQATLVSG
ncbi:MAG: heavy-metal-associated domain-containing protein [Saprospiraceae bacterium]|nr:heavy-metal-associated domain-containing protein [Saprospiraceae bacterium]MBK6564190.1 heavy-metal-associated domain-containing protein [Saprospiraceae bacterium]MBK7524130.1 heavy-metal-associated domain-containing protein [Saprospiraceae bacterium]MBK8372182.1 heavy-metal-associated domain-containing protein [Saprospiraceae bacterium]MBK8547449.1 heavy-metal-associated domain-containing protein [Saprospiraceae bacterium]